MTWGIYNSHKDVIFLEQIIPVYLNLSRELLEKIAMQSENTKSLLLVINSICNKLQSKLTYSGVHKFVTSQGQEDFTLLLSLLAVLYWGNLLTFFGLSIGSLVIVVFTFDFQVSSSPLFSLWTAAASSRGSCLVLLIPHY